MPLAYTKDGAIKVAMIGKLVEVFNQHGRVPLLTITQSLGICKQNAPKYLLDMVQLGMIDRTEKQVKCVRMAMYELVATDVEIAAHLESLKVRIEEKYVPGLAPTKCDPWSLPMAFFGRHLAA